MSSDWNYEERPVWLPADDKINPDRPPRREKLIRVDPRLIIDILNGIKFGEFFYLPVLPQLPEGTVVVSVQPNWERRCIDMLVGHPSFPVVPEGERAPEAVEHCLHLKAFRRRKVEIEEIPAV